MFATYQPYYKQRSIIDYNNIWGKIPFMYSIVVCLMHLIILCPYLLHISESFMELVTNCFGIYWSKRHCINAIVIKGLKAIINGNGIRNLEIFIFKVHDVFSYVAYASANVEKIC